MGDSTVYEIVEQMPSFPGGDEALFEYVSQNIKYPPIAKQNGIHGRVICTFIVERDGSITNVWVVKREEPTLDREAVRVIRSMPKWNPGKQNGKVVRCKYTLPISYKLQ